MAGEWASAIGEALQMGGQTYNRLKREDEELERQKQRDAMSDQYQALQMELMRAAEERAKGADARAQRVEDREVARDIREALGPDAVVDSETADVMRRGGLGANLREQEGMLPSARYGVTADGQMDPTKSIASAGQTAGFRILPNFREQLALNAEQRAGAAEQRATASEGREAELFGLQRGNLETQRAFREWAGSPEGQAAPTDVYNARAAAAGVAGRERSMNELRDLEMFKHRLGLERDTNARGFTKANQWVGAYNDILGRQIAGLQDIVTEETSAEELQALLDQAAERAEALTTRFLGPNPNVPPPNTEGITAEAIASIDSDAQRAGSLQQLFKDANTPEGRKRLTDAGVDVQAYFRELKRRTDEAALRSARDHGQIPSLLTSH